MRVPTPIEEFLNGAIGLDIESVGAPAVVRAVKERTAAHGLADEAGYLGLLNASDQERQALIERIVVPETWFFRDEKPFWMLQKYVVEEWLPARPRDPLRLMSLPCSTGEEPYSMAMALLDIGLRPEQWRIESYDVSRSALARARQAVYGRNSFRGGGLSFRDRYFRPAGFGHRLDDAVRRSVVFAEGNILDPAFTGGKGPYQIIFFRNLMIYLDRKGQERALAAIDRLLAPSGLVFIGHAEASPLLDRWFASVRYPFAFAYRKHSDERRKNPVATASRSGLRVERRKSGALASSIAGVDHPVPPAASPPRPRPEIPSQAGASPRDGRRSRTGPGAPSPPAEGPAAPSPGMAPAPPSTPPEPPDLLEEARKLADQGKLEEARRFCETVLRVQGPRADAYCLLGLLHDAERNPDEAESCFHKAVYLEPGHAEALAHLALSAERRGDLRAARLFRQRARRGEQRHQGETP